MRCGFWLLLLLLSRAALLPPLPPPPKRETRTDQGLLIRLRARPDEDARPGDQQVGQDAAGLSVWWEVKERWW